MTSEERRYSAHTDGASRGNPGPAAFGYTIELDGAVVERYGEYIGETTNNVAEYRAFIGALTRLRELGATSVVLYSDSELAVKQVNGAYRVKNEGLKPLHRQVIELLTAFPSHRVVHVPRERNSTADGLANKALDDRKSAPPPPQPPGKQTKLW